MLVSHSHQKQASLWAVDGDLSDDFVEALTEQFLSNGADPFGSGLSMLQSFIERFLQSDDIVPLGLGVRDILHVVPVLC